MFAFPVLLGDIGGTNARFAVLPAPGRDRSAPAAHPDGADARSRSGAIRIALEAYDGPAPRSAIIAVATRVDAPAIRLTNAHWVIDAEAIGKALDLDRVTLVNDYTPVAASVAVLDEARGDLAPLSGPSRRRSPARAWCSVPAPASARVRSCRSRTASPSWRRRRATWSSARRHDEETALWPHLERVGGRVSGRGRAVRPRPVPHRQGARRPSLRRLPVHDPQRRAGGGPRGRCAGQGCPVTSSRASSGASRAIWR